MSSSGYGQKEKVAYLFSCTCDLSTCGWFGFLYVFSDYPVYGIPRIDACSCFGYLYLWGHWGNGTEIYLCTIWDCDVQVLSRIAATRLQKELTEWQVNPPCGFEHKVTESLQRYAFESRSCLCHTWMLDLGILHLLVKAAILYIWS
jgi:hypothetical protein